MEFQKIRAFVEAAKCLNFTTAANRLFMTPSSLSKYIAQLESSLDFALFSRNNRTVTLTPAGEHMFHYYEKLLREYENNVGYARTLAQGKTRRLKLGTHGFSNVIPELGDMFWEFTEKYPQYQLDFQAVDISEVSEALIHDDSDSVLDGVLTKKHKISSMTCEYKTISTCRLAVLLRKGHELLKNGVTPSLWDMQDYTFITVADSFSSQMNNQFRQMCINAGFVPSIRQVAAPLYSIFMNAMTSNDIAIASEAEAYPFTSLTAIPLDNSPAVETVLAWNPKRNTEDIRLFCNFADEFNRRRLGIE